MLYVSIKKMYVDLRKSMCCLPLCAQCCVFFPSAGLDSPECPPGQFPCMDTVGCVDASARCDGQIQCPTGSDEENCTATEDCLESDWTCRNHICIPKELRCNGVNDCLDNSDEEDCGEKDGMVCHGKHYGVAL